MAQNRTARGATAHKEAMAHLAKLTQTTEMLRTAPALSRHIDGLMEGRLPGWDPWARAKFSFQELIRLGDTLGDCAVAELWKKQGRVIYDLHEELAAALYRSKMDKVPGDLFDHLKHTNPLVVLPDPWPAGKGRGGPAEGYVRCFFIVGWSGKGICNSNDPDRDGLALMFCYDVVDPETGEMVPGEARDLIPLPMDRDSFSAADVVRFAEEWQGGSGVEREVTDAVKTFRPIIQKAFAVLTYLCVDNRDIEDEPAWKQQTRKKTGKGRERAPFWVRVGWFVGQELHTARKRAVDASRSGISIPSGVEYGPQHRAGHFKTVRIGPGKPNERTRKTTVWVEPYWTKLEELPEGQDPATQVVPVDSQRGDPFRRRNTIGK
jgi:hypothetical protein